MHVRKVLELYPRLEPVIDDILPKKDPPTVLGKGKDHINLVILRCAAARGWMQLATGCRRADGIAKEVYEWYIKRFWQSQPKSRGRGHGRWRVPILPAARRAVDAYSPSGA